MKFKVGDKVMIKEWKNLEKISIEDNEYNREYANELRSKGIKVLNIPSLSIDSSGFMLTSELYEKVKGKLMLVNGADEFGAVYISGLSTPLPSQALIKFT